jgi:hypothetical protein
VAHTAVSFSTGLAHLGAGDPASTM